MSTTTTASASVRTRDKAFTEPSPIDGQASSTRGCESQCEDPFFDAFPPEMTQMREQVKRVVPQETTLLLTGETGTGNTRLARLIHELSPRRHEPFLVVDCGAVSPNLI